MKITNYPLMYYNEKDQPHRTNGPAVEYADGSGSWYLNGKRHRLDGPAVDYPNSKCWYLHGQLIPCSSQEEFIRILNHKAFL